MSLLDTVRTELSQADLQNISQQLGADPSQTQQAIDAALPLMVGGMAGAAQQPGGEANIQDAMQNFGGLGGGILGSIFGQHHDDVHAGVQQASGFDAGKAKMLLMLLAPFVLRALAKRRAGAGQGTLAPGADGGIAGSLQQDAQQAQVNAPPQVGGILGKILGALN